jgi:hypothetical protein
VAQTRVDSPESIYNALTSDIEFTSYIGEYLFKGNVAPIDSISIITPGQILPELQSQSGLEVVIHDIGIVTRRDYLTEQAQGWSTVESLVTYQVFLIVWPGATGTTMTNAARRMIEMFSGATSIQTVPTPNELTTLVQTQILIPENSTILV